MIFLLLAAVIAGCAADSDAKTIKIGISGTDTANLGLCEEKSRKRRLKA